jgi:hypothetical protein
VRVFAISMISDEALEWHYNRPTCGKKHSEVARFLARRR